MSDDKKPRTDGPNAIPVLLLKFSEPIDLPRKPGASGLKTEVAVNKPSYDISYLPWMRHFQINYREVDGRDGSTEVFVHESKVKCWEPMPRKPVEPEKK